MSFNCDTEAVITGAPIKAALDGKPVAMNRAFMIRKGQVLKLGKVLGAGARSYLAF